MSFHWPIFYINITIRQSANIRINANYRNVLNYYRLHGYRCRLASEFLPIYLSERAHFSLENLSRLQMKIREEFSKLRRKFYLSNSMNAEIFDTSAIAFPFAPFRIHGSEWRSGTSEETSKVFVRANNRFKPTEKKIGPPSTITFRVHSPLQSNPRWEPACKRSLLLFNFPQRKTRIRQGANPSNILHGNAVLAPRKHNSLDG